MTEKAWNMISASGIGDDTQNTQGTSKEYFWWHTTTSRFGNIFFDTDHGLFQLCIEHASTQMDSCINHQGIHPVHELEIQQLAE